MSLRTFLLLCTCALLAADRASAQAQESPPPRFSSQVIVTPERGETQRDSVPTVTTVLDSAQIGAIPAVYLGEALTALQGFHVARSEFYTGAAPVISGRGFFGGGEAEYILLLVDGIPAYDAESGLIDWSAVTASSIGRIEAIRGPGASVYGESAVGGVIQILTDRARNGGRITTTAGSFNSYTTDGDYLWRGERYGISVNGAARTTSGFTTHSDARQYIGGAAVDGRMGSGLWRARATGMHRFTESPGALTLVDGRLDPKRANPLSAFDIAHRDSYSAAFSIDGTGRAWGHQIRIYSQGRSEDQLRTILLAPEVGSSGARALSSLGVGGSAEATRRWGDRGGVIRFGMDLASQHLETSYSPVTANGVVGASDPKTSGHRVRTAVFASSGWNPAARVRLSGAIRWDHVGDTGFSGISDLGRKHQSWSPRLGVTIRLSDNGGVSAFLQASRAFKVATLDQLFDPRPYPDFRGGTFTISNSRLRPQRAHSYEAGLQGTFARRFHWSALAYHMKVDDEIDFDVQTYSYANIGQSDHNGIELNLDALATGPILPSVSYTFSSVHEAAGDEQLKNVPRHNVVLATTVQLPFKVDAHVRFRAIRGLYVDDSNAIELRGTSSLDLRVRRMFGSHALFVDAINVTNERSEEFGFTLTDFSGNTVAYGYPGAPRALRAGITFDLRGKGKPVTGVQRRWSTGGHLRLANRRLQPLGHR